MVSSFVRWLVRSDAQRRLDGILHSGLMRFRPRKANKASSKSSGGNSIPYFFVRRSLFHQRFSTVVPVLARCHPSLIVTQSPYKKKWSPVLEYETLDLKNHVGTHPPWMLSALVEMFEKFEECAFITGEVSGSESMILSV